MTTEPPIELDRETYERLLQQAAVTERGAEDTDHLGVELIRLLGLPETATKIDIAIRPHSEPLITCEFVQPFEPGSPAAAGALTAVRRYRLAPLESADASSSSESSAPSV